MNNKRKYIKKLIAYIMVVAITFSYFGPLNNVIAFTSHGSGDQCFTFDMDENGFPVSSVTINGEVWDRQDDHQYRTDDNIYTIVIKAGKKGEAYPWISTAGGLDAYKTYTAIENPDDDPNVAGDEYLLKLILNNMPYDGTCAGLGISLQDGPFPVRPVIHAETEVSITISGEELEYHYVEDKPDEADVTYFKFGINSGISEDIVPFTFGNANYVHNDNEPPKNVSSVSTKQPIQYEYDHDGSGFVTFYVNGGATDEYTKIEINGVDYSDQAPHNQIEYFEHLRGFALIFEIQNVPYAESYDVVVEGRQTALENRVGGISWSYLNRERSGLSDDEEEGNFAHGKLEFVSAKYTDIDEVKHEFNSVLEYNNAKFHDIGEIYFWGDGRKDYEEIDRRQAWGSSQVPYGTELTLRIVPDAGYQLVGLAKSPTGFTTTDEVGVYKVVLNAENFLYGNEQFDLQPVFAEIGSEVNASSVNVKSGNISTNEEVENGTIKLEVNDVVSMSPNRMEEFESTATEHGYEIENYLDLSLYNTIYKGGKRDNDGNYESWDASIENLAEKATITLELENDMRGKELALVHERHDGNEITGYDIIEAVYNEENNTITFETDSFSNYAIISRGLENNDKLIVHFDSNGGTPVEDKEVTYNTSVSEPEQPTNGNKIFDGWYEDETLSARFDFNSKITDNITLFAKWIDDEENHEGPVRDTDYKVTNENGSEITFKEEAGHTYHLEMVDYLTLSDAELEAAEISKEEYEEGLELIKNQIKGNGTLIGFFEIDVVDEDDHTIHEGPFNIKIKMTEEMKKYNTFKLIYFNDDFSTEKPIELKVEGDYLVGTLEHLSKYALTGTYVDSATKTKTESDSAKTNNPKTNDNIYMWIGLLIAAIIGIIISINNLKIKCER